jgi:hypothetical protein
MPSALDVWAVVRILYLDKDVGGEPRHGACTLGDLFEVKKVVALTSPLHTTVVLCQNVC